MVRILASAGIHGIRVEPRPRRVNCPARQRETPCRGGLVAAPAALELFRRLDLLGA